MLLLGFSSKAPTCIPQTLLLTCFVFEVVLVMTVRHGPDLATASEGVTSCTPIACQTVKKKCILEFVS